MTPTPKAVRMIHPMKHGMDGTPTYSSWKSMITRVTNQKRETWKNYGGRGITVCERWRKFTEFFRDMGEKPPGTSLDRINNDGNYEPGNCCWTTHSQQNRNRRNNHRVTIDGQTKTLVEWAELSGIRLHTILTRLRLGWPNHRLLDVVAQVGSEAWKDRGPIIGKRVHVTVTPIRKKVTK